MHRGTAGLHGCIIRGGFPWLIPRRLVQSNAVPQQQYDQLLSLFVGDLRVQAEAGVLCTLAAAVVSAVGSRREITY